MQFEESCSESRRQRRISAAESWSSCPGGTQPQMPRGPLCARRLSAERDAYIAGEVRQCPARVPDCS